MRDKNTGNVVYTNIDTEWVDDETVEDATKTDTGCRRAMSGSMRRGTGTMLLTRLSDTATLIIPKEILLVTMMWIILIHLLFWKLRFVVVIHI